MFLKKDEVIKFSLFIRAASAEPIPPLGTILGNYGVSTLSFCKEFNEFTKTLPNYFFLETEIQINLDKTVKFEIKSPTVSLLIKLVTKNFTIMVKESGGYKEHIIKVLYLSDIYKICLFKYGTVNKKLLSIIMGSVGSFGLYIIND